MKSTKKLMLMFMAWLLLVYVYIVFGDTVENMD